MSHPTKNLRRSTHVGKVHTSRTRTAAAAVVSAGLLISVAFTNAPATAATPSRDATRAVAVAESSMSLDWYDESNLIYMPSGFTGVDESRLSAPLPNWLKFSSFGFKIDHQARYPWNAPSSFDIPYLWNEPYGPSQTGVVHVTMSRMPSPPTDAQTTLAPGISSAVDLASLFGSNYMFQTLTGVKNETVNVDGGREDRKFQPLNAEMAKYFTYKLDGTGNLLTLKPKPGAPALPANYWTYDWFAVDYTASAHVPDPALADKYSMLNGGVYVEADRQLRFAKPDISMGNPDVFGVFYVDRGMVSKGKKYTGRRIVVTPLTFSKLAGVDPASVQVRFLKTSRLLKDFRVRVPSPIAEVNDTIKLVLRKGRKAPNTSSFQYQIVGRDRSGALVSSPTATITLKPNQPGRHGRKLR